MLRCGMLRGRLILAEHNACSEYRKRTYCTQSQGAIAMSKVSIRTMSRRQLLITGAGAAGAVVAGGAVTAPGGPAAPAATETKAAPEQGGGYRVSQHVLSYYRTARL